MTNNNHISEQQFNDNVLSKVEEPMSDNVDVISDTHSEQSSDSNDNVSNVDNASKEEKLGDKDFSQSEELYIKKIESLRQSLQKIESEEEYKFYTSSIEYLSNIKSRYNKIQILIQKANIYFEELNSQLSDVISNSKIFEKNFDVLCLFKSPDINKEAKDWFESLTYALELMQKAAKGEKDEKLGRIPPFNFRACIKSASSFDPVYSVSVSTPIYRVKPGTCTDEFFPIAWKGSNSFTLHSKYLLNTEQKLKKVLLMVLPESEKAKEFIELCSAPLMDEDKDLISYMSEIGPKLDSIESDIKCDMYGNVDELNNIETSVSKISNSLSDLNNLLYDAKERAMNCVCALEKHFYKVGLSDLFKLYNDISKLILSFENTDVATLRDEESFKWQKLLLELKNKVKDFLYFLDIEENKPVYENETIWKDDMDFIEIMEAEEDDSKPEGLISKINSIGFHYTLEGKTEYIEKTKVFVFRKS